MSADSLILASGSPFRKELLERLHLPFSTCSPDIDESVIPGETPVDYVRRLAREKAAVVASRQPEAIVIGSDQCALLDGEILGKPGGPENALEQLRRAQGREVLFLTGLCVMRGEDGFEQVDCIEFRVGFRQRSDEALRHYLEVEQPWGCAGSFKSEGYGITLFRYLRGDDPTALIGLPLIRLTGMLEAAGLKVV
jgi:septum formation protein